MKYIGFLFEEYLSSTQHSLLKRKPVAELMYLFLATRVSMRSASIFVNETNTCSDILMVFFSITTL